MWTPKWHLSRNLMKNLLSFEREIKFCRFLKYTMIGLYTASIFNIFLICILESSCCPSLKGNLYLLDQNVSTTGKA